jgi:hypothetical protein
MGWRWWWYAVRLNVSVSMSAHVVFSILSVCKGIPPIDSQISLQSSVRQSQLEKGIRTAVQR